MCIFYLSSFTKTILIKYTVLKIHGKKTNNINKSEYVFAFIERRSVMVEQEEKEKKKQNEHRMPTVK